MPDQDPDKTANTTIPLPASVKHRSEVTSDIIYACHEIITVAAKRKDPPGFKQLYRAYELFCAKIGLDFSQDNKYFTTLNHIGLARHPSCKSIFDRLLFVIDEWNLPWVTEKDRRALGKPKKDTSEYIQLAKLARENKLVLKGLQKRVGSGEITSEDETSIILHPQRHEIRVSRSVYTGSDHTDSEYDAETESPPLDDTTKSRMVQEYYKRRNQVFAAAQQQQRNRSAYVSTGVQTSDYDDSESVTGDESVVERFEDLTVQDEMEQGTSMLQERLDTALKIWRYTQYERVLANWRYKTNYYLDCMDDAAEHYEVKLMRRFLKLMQVPARMTYFRIRQNTNLAHNVIGLWFDRADAVKKRTEETRNKVIQRKYFTKWRDQLTLRRQIQEAVCRFQAQRVLARWRKNMHRYDGAVAFAEDYYCSNLVGVVVETWRNAAVRKAAEREAEAHKQWMAEQAERHYQKTLLQKVLYGMWNKAGDLEVLATDAENHHELVVLDRFFYHWRVLQRMRMFKKWQMTGHLWRIGAIITHYREARVHYETGLASRVLLLWKERTRQRQEERVAEQYWLNNMLLTMLANYRCRFYAKILNGRLVKQTLHLWRDRMLDKQSKAQLSTQSFIADYQLRTTLRILRGWEQMTFAYKDAEISAEQHYKRKVLQGAFRTWVKNHERLKSLEEWMNLAHFYFFTHRCFSKWKQKLKYRRKEQRVDELRNRFIQFTKAKKKDLTRRVLFNWHNKTAVLCDSQLQAEDHYHSKIEDLAEYCLKEWRVKTMNQIEAKVYYRRKLEEKKHLIFRVWQERSQALKDANDEAVAFQMESVIRRGLHTWLDRMRIFASANAEAEHRQHSLLQQSAREIVRAWLRQSTQVQAQIQVAEGVVRKKPAKDMRRLLQRWAAAARENRARREEAERLRLEEEYAQEAQDEVKSLEGNFSQLQARQSIFANPWNTPGRPQSTTPRPPPPTATRNWRITTPVVPNSASAPPASPSPAPTRPHQPTMNYSLPNATPAPGRTVRFTPHFTPIADRSATRSPEGNALPATPAAVTNLFGAQRSLSSTTPFGNTPRLAPPARPPLSSTFAASTRSSPQRRTSRLAQVHEASYEEETEQTTPVEEDFISVGGTSVNSGQPRFGMSPVSRFGRSTAGSSLFNRRGASTVQVYEADVTISPSNFGNVSGQRITSPIGVRGPHNGIEVPSDSGFDGNGSNSDQTDR